MKKNNLRILLLMLTLLLATSCAPLRIVMNSADSQGRRTLCTSDVNLFGEFSIAMGARVAPNDTVMAVLITSSKKSDHGIFDMDDRLMIRLNDGSEVTLTNIYDHQYERNTERGTTTETYYRDTYAYAYSPWLDAVYVEPVTVRTMVPRTYTYTTTKSYALYLISKQQVQDIINKGVTKLRVEIEDADCDMPNPEQAQSRFATLYPFLMKAAHDGVIRSKF